MKDLYNDDILDRMQAALWQARRTCVNCVYFNLASEGCAVAQGQRPPAMVIATGCPKWDGGPPF